ncbi:MAG: rhodanese [Oscillatoriales cyanobacterium SM2_1_8]|nr:rhodanese [Oscillatoriales cyanobacterium SM2_1_8]
MPPLIPEVSPQDLAAALQNPTAHQFLDVREPIEVDLVALPGFALRPLSQFSQWAEAIAVDFDPHRETWVLCHHGVRSYQMCAWLATQGFTQVKNVRGGIDAYACEVDLRLPRY